MRWNSRILAALLGAGLLVLGGCGAEKGAEPRGDEPPVDDTPRLRLEPLPDERAEVLALLLSEEVEAPLVLYQRIHTDLNRIAASDLPPRNSETFRPPRDPSEGPLDLDFFPGGRRRVQNGESATWDSLNAIYKPWFEWPADDSESATAHFPGRLNTRCLSTIYRQVPELEMIGAWSRIRLDGNMLAVERGGSDTLLYAFYRVDRHPPLEEARITLWCYYARSDGISYAGQYDPPADLTPDWWSDFCTWVPVRDTAGNDLCGAEMSHDSVLIRDDPPAAFRRDACETHSVAVVDRTLVIAVSYSGGCKDHALNVIMTPAAFEGDPPRVADLYLRHNANGDMCEALIQDTARVDLLPVLQLYEDTYGQLDAITLHVWDSGHSEFTEIVYDPDTAF